MSVVTFPAAASTASFAPVRSSPVPARKPVLFDYVSPARKVTSVRERDEVCRFRYQVFCQELGFFRPADYPDGRETDEHDDDALHFAARAADGRIVGTVRLIVQRPFPLESHCLLFDHAPCLDEIRAAEISRLAVPVTAQGTLQERRQRQETVVALYKGMILESRKLRLTHWVAAMERTLCRVLKSMGCCFTPIGPEVDYSGPVTPYVAAVDQLWQEQRLTNLY